MKMAAADFAALKAAIEPLDTEARRQIYREGKFVRADMVKDLDTRYRWDLYWQAGGLHGVLPDVTHDYKDTHIDTALRNIVAPLNTTEEVAS